MAWGEMQEGRGDCHRIEAQDRLQDERRTHAGVDGRMGAGEHQAKPIVGNIAASLAGDRGNFFGDQLQMARRARSLLWRRRAASTCLLRATASSQASGLSGVPRAGHSSSAAVNASASASSAPATSPVRAARKATSLP